MQRHQGLGEGWLVEQEETSVSKPRYPHPSLPPLGRGKEPVAGQLNGIKKYNIKCFQYLCLSETTFQTGILLSKPSHSFLFLPQRNLLPQRFQMAHAQADQAVGGVGVGHTAGGLAGGGQ